MALITGVFAAAVYCLVHDGSNFVLSDVILVTF